MGVAGVHGHNCVDRGQAAAEFFSYQLIFERVCTCRSIKRHDFGIPQVCVVWVVHVQACSIILVSGTSSGQPYKAAVVALAAI